MAGESEWLGSKEGWGVRMEEEQGRQGIKVAEVSGWKESEYGRGVWMALQ